MNPVQDMKLVPAAETPSLELLLIDLSSIAYPLWMTSGSEPDPNATATKIVARVRSLADRSPHAAICCDKGRSFRHDVAPSYKANRPEREAALHHQIDLAVETLKRDGFPVWAVKGFEADDLIASATWRALNLDGPTVRIVSSDKDLLQLVGQRVTAMSAATGALYDVAGVQAKLGVNPSQVCDYLTMVGDSSDNVKGIPGIGPKRAAELLSKFNMLDRVYEELASVGAGPMGLTPSIAKALTEFKPHLATTRELITLRIDAEIPFEEILKPRVQQAMDVQGFADGDDFMENKSTETSDQPAAPEQTPQTEPQTATGPAPTALVPRDPDVLAPAPSEWERQLDPRSLRDAKLLAADMFNSRMFSAYGNPQAVLSTVMVGRELGLPAMAALRCVHVIEGKHSLSASLMVALVLRSGLAEFFEPVSFSDTEATYETKRKNGRNAIKLTHTIEMARQAWPKAKPDWEKAFLASGWGRNPTDMLVARASARLARMVYSDLLAGLYTPEELAEVREANAA